MCTAWSYRALKDAKRNIWHNARINDAKHAEKQSRHDLPKYIYVYKYVCV